MGQQYEQQFPQLSAIRQHSAWAAFAEQVKQGHARSLELAHPDAEKRQAAKEMQRVLQAALTAGQQSRRATTSACCPARAPGKPASTCSLKAAR